MRRICLFILVVSLSLDVSQAECVSRGRYPNNDELDCRGYTMCLPMGGNFIMYKIACPLGSVYSHLEQQCTSAATYTCLLNYTCSVAGNFEAPDSCNSYVACVIGLGDIVTARRVECPIGQVFSPSGCVNETEYVCKYLTTTSTITLPTLSSTTMTYDANVTESAMITNVIDVVTENAVFSREVPLNGVGCHGLNLIVLLICYLIKICG